MTLEGTLAYDNKKYILGPSDSIKAICAYVMQFDILGATSTAYEALLFSALLRLKKSIPYEQKVDRVNEILKELKIDNVRDSLIG